MNKFGIITLLIFSGLLSMNISVNAQINVVGDDYSQTLTAKDYYTQDISFENYFPAYSKQIQKELSINPPANVNMLGDTIWFGTSIDVSSPTIVLKGERTLESIPSGYYVVSGYVLGKEETDSISNRICPQYGSWYNHIYANSMIKYIFNDDPNPSSEKAKRIMERIIGYIKLTSIDSSDGAINVYYAPNDNGMGGTYWKNALSLRFYNEVRNGLLNKEVLIFKSCDYCKDIEISFDSKYERIAGKGELVENDLTGEIIKLHDTVFFVKDVIVKLEKTQFDNTVPALYCVLSGENTGTFAKKVKNTYYSYSYEYQRGTYRGRDFFFDKPYVSDESYGFSWRKISIVPTTYLKSVASIFLDTIRKKADFDAKEKNEQERIKKEQQEKWEQEVAQEKAELRQRMISKYGGKYGEMVYKKQLSIGMTKDMCYDAWGWPMNTYSTTTSFGNSEVWCYNYKTRVYFYNGKVVQIDN